MEDNGSESESKAFPISSLQLIATSKTKLQVAHGLVAREMRSSARPISALLWTFASSNFSITQI
jgi:hypothetical protein